MLMGQKEEVRSDQLVQHDVGVIQEPVFEVKTKSLHYTRIPGKYSSDPRPKWIGQTSVEIAVHLWRAALRHSDSLKRSNFQKLG